jgi:hypothetical protein
MKMVKNRPKIKKLIDGYRFSFTEGYKKGIVIDITNIRHDRSNEIIGTLSVYSGVQPNLSVICRGIKLILSSLSSRVHTARILTDTYSGGTDKFPKWHRIINRVCNSTIRLYHTSREIEEIWPNKEVSPLEYLLQPILPLGVHTIIFGRPGSGKSSTATLIALIVQEPGSGDSLGLITLAKPSPVLYLDFENNQDELTWRWSALTKGMNTKAAPILYLSCDKPLAEMVDSLHRYIKEYGIKLLILDSLLGAAGGNPNEAEPVLHLMNALKRFDGVTTLALAHTSKEHTQGGKTTFGSVFYEAFARSVWECKGTQKEGEGEMVIGLYHRKVNRSQREFPIGLRWTFTEDSITVVRCDLKDTKSSGSPTMASDIEDLLTAEDRMKAKEIAEELGKPEKVESIRLTLKRMEKKGLVKHFSDGTWGLPWEMNLKKTKPTRVS